MKKNKQKKTSSLSILSIAKVTPYQEKPHEKYMNKEQLLHFKNILEKWYYQLQKTTKEKASNIQNKTTNFPDPVDRAVQEEEFSLELRNQDRERKLIKKIEYTLKKIQKNNFGFCESCNIEIGIRRLEAQPTADLCVDCKTLAEIKEKQLTG